MAHYGITYSISYGVSGVTVKVVKISKKEPPMLMGIERLPSGWQRAARQIVEKHQHLLVICCPYHLAGVAACVRKDARCLDDQVDADLLDDFHEESLKNKPGLGATLYRLDEHLLPV